VVRAVRIKSHDLHYFLPFLLRGDEFRIAYSEIGTLRSIIPRNINILALTATATQEKRLWRQTGTQRTCDRWPAA